MSAPERTAASTFDRVAFDLTHAPFPVLAAAIRARTDPILKHWRDLSLKAMPHLDALKVEEFRDTVAEILSAAADALQSDDPRQLRGVIESGPQHGIDRFMQNHSLLDLFEEVRILRGVVILEAAKHMQRPFQPDESATFHAIYDIIIQQGVMALVEKQNELLEQSQRATREVNELLLVSSVRQHELTEQALKAEHAAHESEESYRTLFDLSPVAIYCCDLSGAIQDFNPRAAELWGREPELGDIDERFWGSFKLFRPDGSFMPHAQCPMAQVLSGKTPEVRNAEVLIERSDGSRATVIANIRPLRDQQREVKGAINCFYDITERKQTEEALRESEERYRSLVSVITDVPWTADAAGAFIIPQPAWQAYTGQTWEEHRGFGWVNALYSEDRERVKEVWGRACASRTLYETHGKVWHAPTQGWRHFTVKATPLLNADGNVREWVGAYNDIDEQKQVEKDRERLLDAERTARSEVERVGHMKDEFLATLSHELRTPLNAILGWSEMFSRGGHAEPEILQEGMEAIARNARAQAQLINDLFDTSRIVSGKILLDVKPVNLVELVHAAIDAVRHAADAKQVRLVPRLDHQVESIAVDPNRLQQILCNLLTNAVKFTPNGGEVRIVIARRDAHVEISVSDTGQGIRPEFLPYLFERFSQADSSTTRKYGGLGLGLAIVKTLTELHGGTIRAESAGEGQGATFTVTLPLAAAHPMTRELRQQGHPIEAEDGLSCGLLAGVKVLVMDDEPDARALLRRVLKDCDVDVLTVASASDAFEALHHHRFDILVCDIGMPDEDGYQFMQRVRALPREKGGDIPAVALTAFARSEDRQRALAAGYQNYLAKPFEPPTLIAVLAKLMKVTL